MNRSTPQIASQFLVLTFSLRGSSLHTLASFWSVRHLSFLFLSHVDFSGSYICLSSLQYSFKSFWSLSYFANLQQIYHHRNFQDSYKMINLDLKYFNYFFGHYWDTSYFIYPLALPDICWNQKLWSYERVCATAECCIVSGHNLDFIFYMEKYQVKTL